MGSLLLVIAGIALAVSIDTACAGVFVRGVPTCREWVAARVKEKDESRFQVGGESTWLLGFLSGLAIGQNKEFWGGPDGNVLANDFAYRWIDNYCRDNPSKDLDDAGARLFVERTRVR